MDAVPLPIHVPPTFRIIAHRGASAYAPENTTAAFILAAQMGVTEVELDVQLSRDGHVVLCHDTTLARYGHGPRTAEEMTWPDLSSLDMGSWFSPFLFARERMIRLPDLFAHFATAFTYHVEIKGGAPELVPATAAVIEEFDLADQCIVTSFRYEALVAMRGRAPHMRLGWLVERIDDDVLAKAAALGLLQLCPRAANVTTSMVAQARAVTPEVRTWGLLGEGVRDQAAAVQALIQRTLDAGCDGMTINWPDWVTK